MERLQDCRISFAVRLDLSAQDAARGTSCSRGAEKEPVFQLIPYGSRNSERFDSYAPLFKPDKVESAYGCCVLVLHPARDSNVRSFYQVGHLGDSLSLHRLGRPFAEPPENGDNESRRRSEPRAGRTVGTRVDFESVSYSHSLHSCSC